MSEYTNRDVELTITETELREALMAEIGPLYARAAVAETMVRKLQDELRALRAEQLQAPDPVAEEPDGTL